MNAVENRRFGGVGRLYGESGYQRLTQARVCLVGIGGVGSWCAEALARTGIGQLTLIDLDMVAESNTNRQIHALGDIYGKAKVDAMAERIAQINPDCTVRCIEDFVTPDNLETTLGDNFDVVIDAIDQARVKAAMIAYCKRRRRRPDRPDPGSARRPQPDRPGPLARQGPRQSAARPRIPAPGQVRGHGCLFNRTSALSDQGQQLHGRCRTKRSQLRRFRFLGLRHLGFRDGRGQRGHPSDYRQLGVRKHADRARRQVPGR